MQLHISEWLPGYCTRWYFRYQVSTLSPWPASSPLALSSTPRINPQPRTSHWHPRSVVGGAASWIAEVSKWAVDDADDVAQFNEERAAKCYGTWCTFCQLYVIVVFFKRINLKKRLRDNHVRTIQRRKARSKYKRSEVSKSWKFISSQCWW